MMRAKSLLVGSLLIVCQLGCGGSSQIRSRAGSPPPDANISISPASAAVGSADLSITVTASNTFSFADGGPRINKVLWSSNGNETELSSSPINSLQLTAIIPSTLLASAIQAQLRVEVWDHTEDSLFATSSSVAFTVTSVPVPAPSISAISPSTVTAGSPDVTITIYGSNFGQYGHFTRSTAFWTTNGNLHDTGTWLPTTIISDSQLTAVIPATLLQGPTSVHIVVMNGDVMGMSDGYFGYLRSNAVTFTVDQ